VEILDDLDPSRPVLIAGPTASGKSALALAVAEAQGGVIVNADALQVFSGWPILTAQPGADDLARAPHLLYGHLPPEAAYSVGDWLRDVAPILGGSRRPIVVGGTGLYLSALTGGLAPVPPVPQAIRAEGEALIARAGLGDLVAGLDAATRTRIDTANPARVLRAWEVLRATGRGLAEWQARTPAPLLPPEAAQLVLVEAPPPVLTPRIRRRFARMIEHGALDEARAMKPRWNPAHQSAKAIGARELIAHLDGRLELDAAIEAAVVQTRQYAKRQRTWFRARMTGWRRVQAEAIG
jgi:tRNA dimethylallyltransferase